MRLIKGTDVAAHITENIKSQLAELDFLPRLAIIRVGEKPDDIAYERGAKKRMEKTGMECVTYHFDENISNDEFSAEFLKINNDKSIHGILLLRPLPKHIDENAICEMINPRKDIDCISPVNIEKVFVGDKSAFAPCTAEAVMKCIECAGIELCGKNVTVIGRSLVVGKPLSMLLLSKNATVTICHSKTRDLPQVCSCADVLVSCIGRARMIGAEYIREGACVFDVGINATEDGGLCGDVDFDAVADKCEMITPVPGGVGSVTTAVLAEHLLRAAKSL